MVCLAYTNKTFTKTFATYLYIKFELRQYWRIRIYVTRLSSVNLKRSSALTDFRPSTQSCTGNGYNVYGSISRSRLTQNFGFITTPNICASSARRFVANPSFVHTISLGLIPKTNPGRAIGTLATLVLHQFQYYNLLWLCQAFVYHLYIVTI